MSAKYQGGLEVDIPMEKDHQMRVLHRGRQVLSEGFLGDAAAISRGVLIGIILSTEEVAESKIELDELEREQEKKKE